MNRKLLAFRLFLLIFFFTCLFITLFSQTNPNHVWVEGYTRNDGTAVRGHFRTAPNHTNVDNFSTFGKYLEGSPFEVRGEYLFLMFFQPECLYPLEAR